MIQSLLDIILRSTVAWLKVQMGLNTRRTIRDAVGPVHGTVTYQITSDQEDRV